MEDKATFGSLLELVVLAVPAAVILTLVALWWSARRRQRRELPREAADVSSESFHAISQPTSGAVHPAPEPPRQAVLESAETIIAKIESAMERGEKTSLSALYFDLAAAYGRDGNNDARMTALRSAAGNGALYGPHLAHAAARLALGEAAQEAGDLTSACEQWQLARSAFLEGGHTEEHARIEKRMRDNGCPTDWVLTDF